MQVFQLLCAWESTGQKWLTWSASSDRVTRLWKVGIYLIRIYLVLPAPLLCLLSLWFHKHNNFSLQRKWPLGFRFLKNYCLGHNIGKIAKTKKGERWEQRLFRMGIKEDLWSKWYISRGYKLSLLTPSLYPGMTVLWQWTTWFMQPKDGKLQHWCISLRLPFSNKLSTCCTKFEHSLLRSALLFDP